MDRQVAEILDRLKADGLEENTVVFFWSDHGRGLPRYKRWPYETGLRVPLIVRWPGRIEAGTVNGELVCLTDLAPTVLSLAGVKIPAYVQGRALLGEQRGAEPQYVFGGRNRMDLTSDDFIRTCRDRRFRYTRNFTPEVPYAQEIPYMEKSPILKEWRRLNGEGKLTGPQQLWFRQPKPEEELYDTEADPLEVNNLAAKAEFAETRSRLRAALEKWMKDTGDLGGVPEDELIERFWPGRQQPVTAAPVIKRADDGTVTITCATPGASIGYRTGADAGWRIYTGPFKPAAAIRAKAIRLGYKASEEAPE
jgi:arylsulfatase A-like enzyme